MPFGYSDALKARLDASDALFVRTLIRITMPSRTLRWQVGSTSEYSWEGHAYDPASPVISIKPASIINDRDLLEITLSDPGGTQRNRFHQDGIVNRPVLVVALEEETGEALESYAGYTTGMTAQGQTLLLRCSGPFVKAGAKAGIWLSQEFQEQRYPDDKCMSMVGETKTIKWYVA